ncbi:non-ribosomal peptide synthetase [Desulfonema ishimotonii]|uniref:Non-ribosomal peptide synthetase n=1 Tax=Desulfonema ishimotonii TaxID=45657 RepID=A0A401FXT6_9BACT|nr:non-ribosomal peptide synthetase [Desulfonema ishimotonii]GBC61781.1 non-ribosomal peptide synthetase [Desulfonema ishimotonii]
MSNSGLEKISADNLVALLQNRAASEPEKLAYVFLKDGESGESRLTHLGLEQKARSIGARLQTIVPPGGRALLLYPPGPEYIAAFFGCLYAGVMAVPVYPPHPARLERTMPRLKAIIQNAEPAVSLTLSSIRPLSEPLFAQYPDLPEMHWLATDDIGPEAAAQWQAPSVDRDTIAFLQYTSGSTGTPKGVMVSHGNLLSNSVMIRRCFGISEADRGVIWLPPYHDMGLIGGILQPLHAGFPMTIMSPVAFLQNPFRWLEAVSRFRATVSGGPNFAFDLCARKVTDEQRKQLDLSAWRVAFNGAEPIRPETMERFSAAFSDCGFRPEAFYPCYGLAEATLIVSGGSPEAPPVLKTVCSDGLAEGRAVPPAGEDRKVRTLVGSGNTAPNLKMVIVNPDTRMPCPDGEIGEIWVGGENVTRGYWHRPDETRKTFAACLADTGAGPFLRTGDLGFSDRGELFVTGRVKDLIIIRGRNHYPQDIELTAEQSYALLRPGCSAAFSVEAGGEERLVVVAEVERRHMSYARKKDDRRKHTELPEHTPDYPRPLDTEQAIGLVRKAISERHELQAHAVLLLKVGAIPKTSSGKIRRHACREMFLNGTLNAIGESVLAEESGVPAHEPEAPDREHLASASPEEQNRLLAPWLLNLVAAMLKISPDRISPDQPLSSFGLDSITAIELQHRAETAIGVVWPMTRFLEGPSVAQLVAEAVTELAEGEQKPAFPVSVSGPDDDGLSYNQKSLWFMHRLAPDSPAYNVCYAVRILSGADIPALRRAFQTLVARHPSLRTTYALRDGEPVRRVSDPADESAFGFQVTDAADWDRSALEDCLSEEARQPFDLENGPVMRVRLFMCPDAEQIMLLNVHHIATDLWSLSVLMDELGTLYPAERKGEALLLPPPPASYADYVRWQAHTLAGPRGEQLREYWLHRLGGELPVLNLPTDHPRPLVQTYAGAVHSLRLGKPLTRKIKELARKSGATVYMTLLAVFQVLLYRYTGQEDILVGSPAVGRTRPEFEGVQGYFVNPLPMRADLSGHPPFTEFLGRVRRTVLEALAHQDYPFQLLVEQLRPERDPGRSPLFQVMFVLQGVYRLEASAPFAVEGVRARMDLGELSLESVDLNHKISQFDLTMTMAESDGELILAAEYNTDLFETDTIVRMAGHFRRLLEGITEDPEQKIGELPLLPDAERHRLLTEWSHTEAAPLADRTVTEMFEAQAKERPDHVALVFGDTEISYRELNERANRIAHFLKDKYRVRPDDRFGLLLGRSEWVIAGILGILKAGGAYVPMEPSYPESRLRHMIDDSGCRAVLSEEAAWPEFDPKPPVEDIRAIRHGDASDPEPVAGPGDMAYVIYTSGSTGYPKGVAVEHRNLSDYVRTFIREFRVGPGDRVLQQNTITFDASVEEIFPGLCTGGQIVISPNAKSPDLLFSDILRHRITVLSLSPLVVGYLNSRADELGADLRVLISGGDVLQPDFTDRLVGKGVALYNTYGPTEATVCSTYYRVEEHREVIPIGRPIANRRIYILDANLSPVPVGVPGEMFISGAGTTRGYLNRAELTKAMFMPHPFEPGERLYRTGDLGRWLPDGNIEFLGRNDDQVKVRGYRIEPGEIRKALLGSEAVGDAVVVAKKFRGDQKELVAYVTGSALLNTETLRDHLKTALPDYMIPACFVQLDALPLTSGGKVDRKSLPEPQGFRPRMAAAYVSPRTDAEQRIAEVWQEVLRLDRVGLHDNFFDLGGHSLLVIKVQSRLEEIFGRDIQTVELFRHPTVSALAGYLTGGDAETDTALQAVRERAGKQRKAMKRRTQLRRRK